jgi:hypothetical protein
MPDLKALDPAGRTSADSKLDAAIAAASAGEPRARLQIGLPNGRRAVIEFPVPLSPEEALRISGAFNAAYLQQFDAEAAQTKAGIVLPTA